MPRDRFRSLCGTSSEGRFSHKLPDPPGLDEPRRILLFRKAQLHATGYNRLMQFMKFHQIERQWLQVAACRLAFVLLAMTLVSVLETYAQSASPAEEQFQAATQAMREGKLEEAAQGFAAAVKAAPTFAEAYFNLGLVQEEQGRFEVATVSLQKALSLKPRLHGANLFLAIAYYR